MNLLSIFSFLPFSPLLLFSSFSPPHLLPLPFPICSFYQVQNELLEAEVQGLQQSRSGGWNEREKERENGREEEKMGRQVEELRKRVRELEVEKTSLGAQATRFKERERRRGSEKKGDEGGEEKRKYSMKRSKSLEKSLEEISKKEINKVFFLSLLFICCSFIFFFVFISFN